jgi:hypothetical protein
MKNKSQIMSAVPQFQLLNSVRNSLRARGLIRTIILGIDEFLSLSAILTRFASEETYMKFRFYALLGHFPDIENPTTFNEKIQYRKFHEYDSRYSMVSDKHAVRGLVSEQIGDHILTNLHHVTDDPNTIPFDSLPEHFVVKPNHMSGEILFVDSNDATDVDNIKKVCGNWLATTYGQHKGEYWYAEIPPKILIEEDLRDESGEPPRDYKFYVFDGEVMYVHVDSNRLTNHSRRFYTPDWVPQNFTLHYPLGDISEAPDNLETMIQIAETLGSDYDFMRVDLYELPDGSVMFGELTVAPGSGAEAFTPHDVDVHFAHLWNQPA